MKKRTFEVLALPPPIFSVDPLHDQPMEPFLHPGISTARDHVAAWDFGLARAALVSDSDSSCPLTLRAAQLLSRSRRASTKQSYAGKWQHFVQFCTRCASTARATTRRVTLRAQCTGFITRCPSSASTMGGEGGGGRVGHNTQFAGPRAADGLSAPHGETLLPFPPRSENITERARGQEGRQGVGGWVQTSCADTQINRSCKARDQSSLGAGAYPVPRTKLDCIPLVNTPPD